MREPNVTAYYPCQARVKKKVHKSVVQDNLCPHLVKNLYFLGCLPPNLGLISAFQEPETS